MQHERTEFTGCKSDINRPSTIASHEFLWPKMHDGIVIQLVKIVSERLVSVLDEDRNIIPAADIHCATLSVSRKSLEIPVKL